VCCKFTSLFFFAEFDLNSPSASVREDPSGLVHLLKQRFDKLALSEAIGPFTIHFPG